MSARQTAGAPPAAQSHPPLPAPPQADLLPNLLPGPLPNSLPGPLLTIVVPTFNEAGNVERLVASIEAALPDPIWEVMFVDDDSTDGTVEALRGLAQRDRRVRVIHRVGRRGLASACIEGVQASSAAYVAVMDADLQHDETLLPRMLAVLQAGEADLAVGSRYVAGGSVGGWDGRRAGMSSLATRLGRLVLKVEIADPMSGFFMLPRAVFDRSVRRLSAIGFKILVDILASSPAPLRVTELPYAFRERNAGSSKLDSKVVNDFVMLLGDKLFGHIVPVRFVMFSAVGLVGLAAHLCVLWLGINLVGLPFSAAQATATFVAMVGNFTLNNSLTYSDRRLSGWRFVTGLISFCLVCGVGAIANVGVASFLFGTGRSAWWVAGVAGAAMSSVWNYAASSFITWRRR